MIVINILIFVAVFLGMEAIAWLAHRYIMHGLFWNLHEDHHDKSHSHSVFEWNDSFFLIFATPAIVCMVLGSIYNVPYCMVLV